MDVYCSECGAVHQVDENKIPDGGASAVCRMCKERFRVAPPERMDCPKCNKRQKKQDACLYCGVIVAKYKNNQPPTDEITPHEPSTVAYIPGVYGEVPHHVNQAEDNKYLYKVVEQKARSFFHGVLTARRFEEAINSNAAEGWHLDRVVSAHTRHFVFFAKSSYLLIFKRKTN